jgi:hypothetical protein
MKERSAAAGGRFTRNRTSPSERHRLKLSSHKAWAQVKALRSENALHLRGVITGPTPLIIVNHTTLAPGEQARIPLVGHNVTVRCLQVTAQSARISVNGKPDTLYLASEYGAQP